MRDKHKAIAICPKCGCPSYEIDGYIYKKYCPNCDSVWNNTISSDSIFTCNTCPLRFICKGPSLWNGLACRGARSQILKDGA